MRGSLADDEWLTQRLVPGLPSNDELRAAALLPDPAVLFAAAEAVVPAADPPAPRNGATVGEDDACNAKDTDDA